MRCMRSFPIQPFNTHPCDTKKCPFCWRTKCQEDAAYRPKCDICFAPCASRECLQVHYGKCETIDLTGFKKIDRDLDVNLKRLIDYKYDEDAGIRSIPIVLCSIFILFA